MKNFFSKLGLLLIYAIAFAILFSVCSCSTVKTYAPSASLAFVAGASHGTAQVLQHHNSRFFAVFPNANERFFGPQSWRNKYYGFDPQNRRNRIPIWLTDGPHLFNSVTQVSAFSSGLLLYKQNPLRRNWKNFTFRLGISFLSYTAGNYLTYNIIFK